MGLLDRIVGYWDDRSPGFSEYTLDEIRDRGDSIASGIIGRLGAAEGSRVLDLGCGPGSLSIPLARRGMLVHGVDYSEGMLSRARANSEAMGTSIEFSRMDAQDLLLPDGSFDHVVSRDLLWNLERPEDTYREILRVLRPGGTCVVMDGNYYHGRVGGGDGTDRPSGRGHESYNRDGVDFSIMEDIARELPLTSADRPGWDVGTLLSLGACGVEVVETYGDPPVRFTLVFGKVVG